MRVLIIELINDCNMIRFITIILLVFSSFLVKGQAVSEASISQTMNLSISYDTLKSFLVKKEPPYLFNANLNHKERSIGNKMLRGNIYTSIYNASIMTYLLLSPTWLSRWDHKSDDYKAKDFFNQFKRSYTKPPVIDEDLFVTNYIGHPYQGGYYYNSVRSQGANIWQSSLYCLGQSLVWEYIWEAGFEQPSIQDMIVTPIGGVLVGELSHVATIEMSKHGFRWYEILATCVINPAYALNNKFVFNKKILPKQ